MKLISMRYRQLSSLMLLLILMAQNMNLCAQIVWHNPLEDSSLPVQGRGWNQEIGKTYSRLPLRVKEKICKSVWNLSQESAGLYIKFHTNAANIQVKYKVNGELSISHIPVIEGSGVDLYTMDSDGNQSWCAGRWCSFNDTIIYSYENLTYANPHNRGNEYCLYLPLYNKVEFLQIGVPIECRFDFVRPSLEKPIVIYGAFIAPETCTLHPSLAWTNMLQRKLDTPVINLGFSDSGQLDEKFLELIAELDASLVIIGYMSKMTGEPIQLIKNRLKRIVQQIRRERDTPVLLVECDGYMECNASTPKIENFIGGNKQLQVACHLLEDSIKGLYCITLEELGLSAKSSIDVRSAEGLGIQQYVDAYAKKIKSILYPAVDSLIFKPCRQYRDADTYCWNVRHEEILKYNADCQPKIVMIGNSIIHYWGGMPFEKNRKADDVWQKLFKGKSVVNMGFGWDRIENMAWRIIHGELDGFKAGKVFMLMGTNNLQQDSDMEIVEAIGQVVDIVKEKQKDAQLYVLNILPRRGFEYRLKVLNHLLTNRLAGESNVQILDFSSFFLNKDGRLKEELFSDGLHPNHKGYEIISKELSKYLE